MMLLWILIPKIISGFLLVYYCRGLDLEDFEVLVLFVSQIPKLRFLFWKIFDNLFVFVL